MAPTHLSKSLRRAIIALCFAFISAVGAAVPAQSAATTGLRLDPATARAASGETITLKLWVNVENLCRAELHLDYDAGLEVQDADPNRAGVQVRPGPVFDDDCIQWNEAAEGKIHFVAQRGPTDQPFSGSDVVASITVLVTAAEPGAYTISFDQGATLLDCEGTSIPVDQFTDATIILLPPKLSGRTTREGWNHHERSSVIAGLYAAAPPYAPIWWGSACSNAAGNFTLEDWNAPPPPLALTLPVNPPVPSCTSWAAFTRLGFTNYLSECYWKCADGDVLDIGWHDLEGGDVNGDGCINILDITRIVRDYDENVPSPCYVPYDHCPPADPPPNAAPSSDLNGDCRVDILDLSQAAGNFGLCSNCPP